MNNTFDIGRAVSFPFDENEWVMKSIVGSIFSIIPFVGPGYQVHVVRNYRQGKAQVLPENNELGEVFADGLMVWIAQIIILLPLFPLSVLMAVFMGIADAGPAAFVIACPLALGTIVLMIAYGIPATLVMWMGMIRFTETGNFSSFLQFRDLWRDVRANMSIMLMLLVWLIVVGFAVALLSSVLWITCVGLFVLGFAQKIVGGHLIGQAAVALDTQPAAEEQGTV
ncbi:MAG: DUF4013 domain-containing protein [Chloroflexi bacterium]|nr:DUF4013 domain-containing protein [Chloroflexota bacterium]